MKKKSKAKSAPKKEEKAESAGESSKAEEAVEAPPTPTLATPEVDEESKADDGVDSKDAEETVAELSNTTRQRQASLSIQSKIRSSSFRQSTGGPLSPGYTFSPDGDTAPDIYRKQAIRIEELERENKKLTKDVSDGERRWKKAEEELEEIREAEDEPSTSTKDASGGAGSPDELEKLVLSRPSLSQCANANHTLEIRDCFPETSKHTASCTNIPSYSSRLFSFCLNGRACKLRSRVGIEIFYDRIHGDRNLQSSRAGRTSKLWQLRKGADHGPRGKVDA